MLKHMKKTGAELPESDTDLDDFNALVPPEVKAKLQLRQCAGCKQVAILGNFRACGGCGSVRYWCAFASTCLVTGSLLLCC